MHKLNNQNVAGWKRDGNAYVPAAIDICCPDCTRLVSFAVTKWQPAPQNIKVGPVRCPGCNGRSIFLLTNYKGESGELGKGERLFVDRAPAGRHALPEILENEEIGEALKRAYSSAVNVFNSGEWNATAVLTRRLLEGVTKSLLDQKDQSLPLAKQVEKLPTVKDLNAPITTIADAIRKGGNLGAHFDLEKEPDQAAALLMLELAEELLEYFYVLPERIEQLHETIEKLGREDGA